VSTKLLIKRSKQGDESKMELLFADNNALPKHKNDASDATYATIAASMDAEVTELKRATSL
jgi:hypothetical protein